MRPGSRSRQPRAGPREDDGPQKRKLTHVSLLLNPALELWDGHVDVDDHVGRQVLLDGDLPHLVVVAHTWHTREAPAVSGQSAPRCKMCSSFPRKGTERYVHVWSRAPGTAVGPGCLSDL